MIGLLLPLLAPVAGFLTFFGIFLLMVGLGGSRKSTELCCAVSPSSERSMRDEGVIEAAAEPMKMTGK